MSYGISTSEFDALWSALVSETEVLALHHDGHRTYTAKAESGGRRVVCRAESAVRALKGVRRALGSQRAPCELENTP